MVIRICQEALRCHVFVDQIFIVRCFVYLCCRLEILFISALLRLGDFHFAAELLQIALIFVDLKQRISLRVIKNL